MAIVAIFEDIESHFFKMKLLQNSKELMRGILAFSLISIGILHFVSPEPFIKIVPSILPYPLALVYISGIFEILGGFGLLIPSFSRATAWGIIALFIAVFPANINQAINQISLEGVPDNPWLYYARLPLQAVLIAWAWWYTRPNKLGKQLSIVPKDWQ